MTQKTYPPDLFTHDNLLRLSCDYLVLVLFLRSRSDVFPLALDLAKRAPLFAERDLETLKIHVAGFPTTFDGASRAMDLIHYVRGWRGTHFYAQGRMIIGEMDPAFEMEAVLKCFADSCAARDYRSHCFRLIDDPFNPLAPYRAFDHVAPKFRHLEPAAIEGTYVFPCRHMLQWFRLQETHPASIPDQIHAEGVARYCDVCPRFAPDDFALNSTETSKK